MEVLGTQRARQRVEPADPPAPVLAPGGNRHCPLPLALHNAAALPAWTLSQE